MTNRLQSNIIHCIYVHFNADIDTTYLYLVVKWICYVTTNHIRDPVQNVIANSKHYLELASSALGTTSMNFIVTIKPINKREANMDCGLDFELNVNLFRARLSQQLSSVWAGRMCPKSVEKSCWFRFLLSSTIYFGVGLLVLKWKLSSWGMWTIIILIQKSLNIVVTSRERLILNFIKVY